MLFLPSFRTWSDIICRDFPAMAQWRLADLRGLHCTHSPNCGACTVHTHSTGSVTDRGTAGLHSGTESLSEQDVETGALSGLDGGTGSLSGLNSGTRALSGLDEETGALSELDRETGALSGLNSGMGALSGLNSGTGALSGMDRETGVLSGLNSGTRALSGLDEETGALSGLDAGTGAFSGLDGGTGATESSDEGGRSGGRSAYKTIRSPSTFHSPRSINNLPSAMVQWAELTGHNSLPRGGCSSQLLHLV